MKSYLRFSIKGELLELKTKEKTLDIENYTDYKYFEKIKHNKYNYIILYNKDSNDKNITVLPFYDKEIYGDFLLFMVDEDENLKSITESKFLKLINVNKNDIYEYSSDDFNLSD